MIVLVLGTGPLLAQTTTWYYDTTNNAAAAGSSATVFTDIGTAWQDTFISQLQIGSNFGSSIGTQANPTSQFDPDDTWQIWSFGDLGITPGDIAAASLGVSFDGVGSQPAGVTNTWTIFGFTGGPVDQSTMTYTNSFSGIDLGTTYGTFQTTGLYVADSWFNINVTSALQAYAAGTISGIVIGNVTESPLFTGAENALNFNTSEDAAGVRPGLQVTTIPEPSAALLGAFGALALLRRRRA